MFGFASHASVHVLVAFRGDPGRKFSLVLASEVESRSLPET